MLKLMARRWCNHVLVARCLLRSSMDRPTLPIDQIEVGFRYRKDLGDLRALADSIAEVGLLHPVVVTHSGRLIAGQRRLQACRQLGWTEVPVTIVDLLQAARGEAHENFVRKDLLPSEIVALKRAIEPLERRAGRARPGNPRGPSPSAPLGATEPRWQPPGAGGGWRTAGQPDALLSSAHCGGMSGGRPRQDRPLSGSW